MKKKTLKIFEELDTYRQDYRSKTIEIVEGLPFSQYKTVRMCEFYSNSVYLEQGSKTRFGGKITGKNKDLLGRDKPFYNIVNYRVSLAKTATDMDIKDITVVSDNPKHWVKAMFLNKETFNWMDKSNFSLTLNRMGYTRPKYGGYLVKKTMKEDKDGADQLHIDVVEWKNVSTSQTDILGNPIIEQHFMSPIDIMKKSSSWGNTKEVLQAYRKLKGKSQTIDVFEVTGEFPKATYADAEDQEAAENDAYEYSMQKYFIAVIGEEKFKMFCEEYPDGEMLDFYDYLPWEEMSGRGLGKGVIEDSEEAQVWTNDAVIGEKRAMDLAGRVGIKTNSKKLGNNILDHDFGKIYELATGEDINSFNLAPSALGQFQNQIEKWKSQADLVTSSFDAATGEQPPSGTPLGTTQLLNQVATKPFDYRREEWGIHLTAMFKRWVLPFVIKKLYAGHTLRADYSDDELELIDADIHAINHNEMVKNMTLEGVTATQDHADAMQTAVQGALKKFGKTRFIDFPDGYFDDIEANIKIITTGEQKNKAAIMQSLSTILETVIKSWNPNTGTFGVLEDPKLSKIFGTLIEMSQSGISPIGLGISTSGRSLNGPAAATPAAPTSAVPSPLVNPQQSAPLASAVK